jgi:GT2 family glycosyltransferase
MRVSIVVPAYNDWALTRRCLDVLFAVTPPGLLAEVVVVDDGSTDGESAAWTSARDAIVPVVLTENGGFGRACNAGAARCSGEAILFLNNDAFVRRETIATLAAVLDDDASIGIVGARLLYADGQLQHAGLALLPGSVAGFWHVHRQRAGDLPDANVARDFLALTGAALMIRRPLFARLGGFDAGFVNGWEDVDLCLRAWCAGARVRYEPRAVLEHLESATRGRGSNHSANETRFTHRWEARLAAAPRYPLADVPPVALAVSAAARGRPDEAWPPAHVERCWKAHLGAAVDRITPGSRLERARFDLRAALARRRPTLEIAWDDACLAPATGRLRVAYVAPRTAADARAYAGAPAVAQWWTPTDVARDALLAAGAPPDRVLVARLGAMAGALGERGGTPVVAVPAEHAALLDGLPRALPEARLVLLPGSSAADFAGVDVVVAPGGGDRWGLLVSGALAHGCSVIATPPLDGFLARALGVTLVADELLFAATLARLREVASAREAAHAIRLAARRTLDAQLATQHIAELARAVTHGTPSSALAAVTPGEALRLRRWGRAQEVPAADLLAQRA